MLDLANTFWMQAKGEKYMPQQQKIGVAPAEGLDQLAQARMSTQSVHQVTSMLLRCPINFRSHKQI
jgi:hypothetical protein